VEEFNLQPLDFTKMRVLFLSYLVFPIFAGFIMRKHAWMRKTAFLTMCFLMTSGFFHAQEWGFTIHSMLYRGHSRGFHFFWSEVAALALIWASMFGDWKRFRFFPPGFWLYLLYFAACCVSLLNADVLLYGLFAALKALKIIIVFVAAYNFIKTDADVRFVLISLGLVMLWQLIVVLDQKYIEGIYQVWGTFEHQNSLCMFTIMIGMVFLAVAMGPKRKSSLFFVFMFVACAAIVQSTLSRAGLFIFAVGTVFVACASLLDKPTRRRLTVLASLAVIGIAGLAMTMDTIIARFNEYGTDESKNTRDQLNVASRLMLEANPFGIGWNNYGVAINYLTYSQHIDDWHLKNGNKIDRHYKKGIVESLWWLHLAETGYQGLITYLILVALFLWWNFRNAIYYHRRYLGSVSIGIFFGFTMNYLQSFLERVLTQPRNMMLWLLLMAMTARITTWRIAEKRRRNREWRERIDRIPVQRQIEYREPVPA
jgi:hypothetical protein